MLDTPSPPAKHGKASKPPDVQVSRAGGRLRVEYDVTSHDPQPHQLVVTVNSEDEAKIPPRTLTIPVHSTGHGKVTTEIALDPLKRYDVSTSTIAGQPPIPSESVVVNIPPFSAPKPNTQQRVLAFISSAVARVRGDRRRG